MKRLSVIIPIYNAADKIEKCLNSVVKQLTNQDELLLINDGSTDNSLDILNRYSEKYSFIKVIDKENEGVAETRNMGIGISSGKYIIFIDNDDYIDDGYIEKYYNAISEGDYDFVIGGYRRVEGNQVRFTVKTYESDWYKLMVVAPWAKIYRRDVLINNDISFLNYGIGEDNYFSIKLYESTDKVGFINYVGYNWYFNDASISNTNQKGLDCHIDILYLLEKLYAITGGKAIYRYYYLRYVVWYLLFSGKNTSAQIFYSEYIRYFKWLKEHGIKSYFPMFNRIVSAEALKNRLIISVFVTLHNLGLVKLFSRIYCR